MQMNRIEIAGFTTADPALRYLASGTKVVNLRLGESHRYAGTDKQTVTQTNWHSLTFYNALAEQAMSFKKGVNLFVEGSVQQRRFKPRDGSDRTVYEVIVQSCHVIGSINQPATDDAERAEIDEELPNETADFSWPL